MDWMWASPYSYLFSNNGYEYGSLRKNHMRIHLNWKQIWIKYRKKQVQIKIRYDHKRNKKIKHKCEYKFIVEFNKSK